MIAIFDVLSMLCSTVSTKFLIQCKIKTYFELTGINCYDRGVITHLFVRCVCPRRSNRLLGLQTSNWFVSSGHSQCQTVMIEPLANLVSRHLSGSLLARDVLPSIAFPFPIETPVASICTCWTYQLNMYQSNGPNVYKKEINTPCSLLLGIVFVR